ncbi:MAG: hypothetical protein AAGD11_20985 [Planctomycetota bacterium]
MEAQIIRRAVSVAAAFAAVLSLGAFPSAAHAAGYRTTNFTVDAPTPRLAKEIGDAAEHYRSQLAQEWLGSPLPNWSKPCPIKAKVAPRLGAGGATSFVFDRGEVFGWRMEIQGSRERILDSVVPHEVTHTIFASHFRQPIPRWADEGACTTVEHRSEIAKQEHMLIDQLQTRRSIPFSRMFAMKEYPRDVMPLYSQGHALAQFLIEQRGKREFLQFLEDGLADDDWIRAVRDRYGYQNLQVLQDSWQNWIVQGRPPLQLAADAQTDVVLLASHTAPSTSPQVRPAVASIRGQDPGITPTPHSQPPVAQPSLASANASVPRSNQAVPATASTRPLTSVYDAGNTQWR